MRQGLLVNSRWQGSKWTEKRRVIEDRNARGYRLGIGDRDTRSTIIVSEVKEASNWKKRP